MLQTYGTPLAGRCAKYFLTFALACSLSIQAHADGPGVALSSDAMGGLTAGFLDLYTLRNAMTNQNLDDYIITGSGGSIDFIGFVISGAFGQVHQTIDEITFRHTLVSIGLNLPASFYGGGPVSQSSAIADPNALPSVSIDAIKMGNSNASFGSIRVKRIDMRGTSSWSWTH